MRLGVAEVMRQSVGSVWILYWILSGALSDAFGVALSDAGAPQIIGKTQWIGLPYLFAHLHLLASHSFSSLIFSLLDFSSLTLPTSAFPSLHIVGSLTSKLPSISYKLWGDFLACVRNRGVDPRPKMQVLRGVEPERATKFRRVFLARRGQDIVDTITLALSILHCPDKTSSEAIFRIS